MSIKKFVEELSSIIPGLSGYYDMEKRREEDTLFRDYIVRIIEEVEKKINERIKNLSKAGETKQMDKFGSIVKNIERIKDTIRFTSYGYKGFFDIVDINEETLEKILNFEVQLLRMLSEFDERILDNPDEISNFLKDFETIFNEKTKIINIKNKNLFLF